MRNSRRVFEQKGYTTATPPANVVDRSRFGNNGTLVAVRLIKKSEILQRNLLNVRLATDTIKIKE